MAHGGHPKLCEVSVVRAGLDDLHLLHGSNCTRFATAHVLLSLNPAGIGMCYRNNGDLNGPLMRKLLELLANDQGFSFRR